MSSDEAPPPSSLDSEYVPSGSSSYDEAGSEELEWEFVGLDVRLLVVLYDELTIDDVDELDG